MRKVIQTSKAPNAIGPYSQAIMVENTLYVSGQIPLDPETGELVSETIEEETDRVMQNLSAILQEAGMTFSNIAKCSIFVKDLSDFVKVNDTYGKYFPTDPPARETVEVSRLPKDVRVEISCIAIG